MIGSDLMVAQLDELDLDYLALNPGATLRGLHESLINGGGRIRPITCLHEGIAVGLAHGYAKARGEPMAVGLHDTVGALNAALAVYNAWVDRAPIVLLDGVGPLDSRERRPWIDWVHTTTDTPAPLRESLVWAQTPTGLGAALDAIRSGHQRAMSTPRGPAWVGLDVSLQRAQASRRDRPMPRLPAWIVEPDAASIAEAARLLETARRPVVVTDRPLTDRGGEAVVRIAEAVGAALVELEGAANVPAGHPLDRSDDWRAIVAAADVVLLVDLRDAGLVVGGATNAKRATVARAIELSDAPLGSATWMVSASEVEPAVRLVGDPSAGAARLAEAVRARRRSGAWPPDARDRRSRSLTDGSALDPAAIAAAAGSILPSERTIVAHGALGGHVRRELRLTRASQYLGRSGGEGLGYALPASIGVALAWRGTDRIVVGFETDGDTMYLPQALWTAAHESIPLLAIVNNNRSYARDEIHQRDIARERGRDAEAAAGGVTLTDPDIDIAGLARSLGVEADGPVATVGELCAALRRGLEVVASGAPFVVEARTEVAASGTG